jgi:hypothetical protein
MQMTPEIEEFAKTLVQLVRDAAIQGSDMTLRPTVRARVADRWRAAARDEDATGFARVVIPDVVGEAIFYLLHALDNGDLRMTFTSTNGRIVDLTDEGLGEMAGWYMGSGGWREMYSKERFTDDFSDLRNDSS